MNKNFKAFIATAVLLTSGPALCGNTNTMQNDLDASNNNTPHASSSTAAQTAPILESIAVEQQDDSIRSAYIIDGQASTLETLFNYVQSHSQAPKDIDETVKKFIDGLYNPALENVSTTLIAVYSNDDNRTIPHPNQYKKSTETMALGSLRQGDDYLYNAQYDASGKTNKQVCLDIQNAKSTKRWDKTLLSTYTWESYENSVTGNVVNAPVYNAVANVSNNIYAFFGR